jgi:hypothetical protein
MHKILTRSLYFLSLVFAFLSGTLNLHATHYRAGEITYKQLVAYTFEITVITFTDPTNVGADRAELEVNFGDGKSKLVPRSNGSGQIINPDLNNRIKVFNLYF